MQRSFYDEAHRKYCEAKATEKHAKKNHVKWHIDDAMDEGKWSQSSSGQIMIFFGPSRSFKGSVFIFFFLNRSLSSLTAFYTPCLWQSRWNSPFSSVSNKLITWPLQWCIFHENPTKITLEEARKDNVVFIVRIRTIASQGGFGFPISSPVEVDLFAQSQSLSALWSTHGNRWESFFLSFASTRTTLHRKTDRKQTEEKNAGWKFQGGLRATWKPTLEHACNQKVCNYQVKQHKKRWCHNIQWFFSHFGWEK